jgi:hypothetical protein
VLRNWRLAAVVPALAILAVGCSDGGVPPGTREATATTFTTDRVVVSGLRTMVTDAQGASLFAASGAGGSQANDVAVAWRDIRSRVALRDSQAASTIDAAVAQLQSATGTRDPVGASAGAATIAATAADYTKTYP